MIVAVTETMAVAVEVSVAVAVVVAVAVARLEVGEWVRCSSLSGSYSGSGRYSGKGSGSVSGSNSGSGSVSDSDSDSVSVSDSDSDSVSVSDSDSDNGSDKIESLSSSDNLLTKKKSSNYEPPDRWLTVVPLLMALRDVASPGRLVLIIKKRTLR